MTATLRLDGSRDKVEERGSVRKAREPAARVGELPACAAAVSCDGLEARSGEMVETTHELILVARDGKDPRESAGGGVVLTALELPFRPPESRAQPGLGRGPVIHGRRILESAEMIDRARSTARIEHDIETLAGRDYTLSSEAVCRYAYTQVYRNTLDYLGRELRSIGFDVDEDPVGTLVARNRPPGEQVFGIGSHCDSNRNGGRYDGTMGVVTALEVCRLNEELGLKLPLQLVSFLEEEGSGFGQMLLGSRIMVGRVTEEELKHRFVAIDDGRGFWEHAREAGYETGRWRGAKQVEHH